jgi:hypothetical protein
VDLYQRGGFFIIRYWLCLFLFATASYADQRVDTSGWQKQKVNWRGPNGKRIRQILYPPGKPVPTADKQKRTRRSSLGRKKISKQKTERLQAYAESSEQTLPAFASLIESPPIDGFVPWIAVAVTNKRNSEDDFEADIHTQVVGTYPASNPESDYAIGILDSGASAHVVGYQNAILTGLYTQAGIPKDQFITSNIIPISGITGSVDALTSMPLGVFVDGLGAIEPNGLLTDRSAMVGQSNVSIVVGQEPFGIPDLATAIGSPLSVYFNTSLRNDRQVTIIRDSEQFTTPDVRFYSKDDGNCPRYTNSVPLELRPLGGVSVQYIPTIDPISLELIPASPSTIVGNLAQSLFFVHSVDLYEGAKSAIDKDRFMLDTGAQLTVVGKRVAARLALDPNQPEFIVVVEGVTGETIDVNGFYIDTIEIPALGQWLSYTNVPVIMLDVASPEGGTLDGIIGMNLFNDFKLVLRGGGLFLEDDPALEFEPINFASVADIVPDGIIDQLDLAELVQSWLANPDSENWDPVCDIAPHPVRDGDVNFRDFAELAKYWLMTVNP